MLSKAPFSAVIFWTTGNLVEGIFYSGWHQVNKVELKQWVASRKWMGGGHWAERRTTLLSAVTELLNIRKCAERGGWGLSVSEMSQSLFSGKTVTTVISFSRQQLLKLLRQGFLGSIMYSFGGTESLSEWIRSSVSTRENRNCEDSTPKGHLFS